MKSGKEESGETYGNDLEAAREGSAEAFRALTEPHRNELLTHCYRMLGSLEDAEDQVQETFLRAWRRLETYEGRATFRAWLYKIATHACLDLLERRPRRSTPVEICPPSEPGAPLPPPSREPLWLQPYPDELLAPEQAGPEARYEVYESISLAFLIAQQVLPPRQRAILILVDVLDWAVADAADLLGISISAATSLLHRARMAIENRKRSGRLDIHQIRLAPAQAGDVLQRYVRAWEKADIESLVAMLRADAVLPMPPLPVWYQGSQAIRAVFSFLLFGQGEPHPWRLLPAHANGQPAVAFYRLDPESGVYHPFVLQVLTVKDDLITEITTFGYPQLFGRFGLPESLKDRL
jgi:RNA polymerase sigma-70 factor (ECF subfamily)